MQTFFKALFLSIFLLIVDHNLSRATTLILPSELSARPREKVKVPISIDMDQPLVAVTLQLDYDPTFLKNPTVSITETVIRKWTLITPEITERSIKFGAQAEEAEKIAFEDGTLVHVSFEVGDRGGSTIISINKDVTKVTSFAAALVGGAPEQPNFSNTTLVLEIEGALQVTITATPTDGTLPLEVRFTAEVTDPGKITKYEWDFGDGTTKTTTSPSLSYIYTTAGTFNATVTAVDNLGAKTTSSPVPIKVRKNEKPTVTLTASPTAGPFPLEVEFIATATDPDGQVFEYKWDFGDGTTAITTVEPPEPTTVKTIKHAYTKDGTFTAKVIVMDNRGAPSDPASILISVSIPENKPPTVKLFANGKEDVAEGQKPFEVTFRAEASDPDNIGIDRYEWDFDDGTADITTVNTIKHAYTKDGTFTAKVTVFDKGLPQASTQASASDSVEIKVFERILSGKIRFTEVDSKDVGKDINIWIEAFSPSVGSLRKTFVPIPNAQAGSEASYSLLLKAASDYKVKPWLKDPYFIPEETVDLSQEEKSLNFDVKIAREIKGTVTDKDTGNALAEASVDVYEIDRPGGGIVAFAGGKRTGSDGKYSIRVLKTGWYRVIVVPPGFPKAKADRELTGLELVVDFAISKGGSFDGVVKDSEGKPIANAAISALFEGVTPEELINTSANEEGKYTLAGLKFDKIYSITASAHGFKETHTVAIDELGKIDPSKSRTDDTIDRPQDFILRVMFHILGKVTGFPADVISLGNVAIYRDDGDRKFDRGKDGFVDYIPLNEIGNYEHHLPADQHYWVFSDVSGFPRSPREELIGGQPEDLVKLERVDRRHNIRLQPELGRIVGKVDIGTFDNLAKLDMLAISQTKGKFINGVSVSPPGKQKKFVPGEKVDFTIKGLPDDTYTLRVKGIDEREVEVARAELRDVVIKDRARVVIEQAITLIAVALRPLKASTESQQDVAPTNRLEGPLSQGLIILRPGEKIIIRLPSGQEVEFGLTNLRSISHGVELRSRETTLSFEFTPVAPQRIAGFSFELSGATPVVPDLTLESIDPNFKSVSEIEAPSDGVFHFNISSINNEGERSTSQLGPFIVDTNPPVEVAKFKATPQAGQVELSWLNPGDGDYKGTLILFRTDRFPERIDDGTLVTDDTTTPRASSASFTHTGLTPKTTYFYTAFTHDAAENFSAGTRVNITTPKRISIDEILPSGRKLKDELADALGRIANIPGISISQNSTDGIVEIPIFPGLSVSATVEDFVQRDPPPDGKPQISVDQDRGIITLTTPSGVQVNLAPAPRSIAEFNTELKRAGVDLAQVSTKFFEGQIETRIADTRLSLKPDFLVMQTDKSPGISIDAQGNTVITYEGGKQQVFFPYIVNWIEFRDTMKAIPGAERIQVNLDGIIGLTFQGVSFRFKPDFLITTVPPVPEIKFEAMDKDIIRITFKDGAQQIVRLTQ